MPICVGEQMHNRYEFAPIFENDLADYITPDVTWAGGISEVKKISTMAEAYYVPTSPHDASGPINVLAGAHTMMTAPNFYKFETTRAKLNAYDILIAPPRNSSRAPASLKPARPRNRDARQLSAQQSNRAVFGLAILSFTHDTPVLGPQDCAFLPPFVYVARWPLQSRSSSVRSEPFQRLLL